MTWVKVDDSFPDHPKVVRLTVAARWAYVEALCYCARYLTDGKIADGKVRTFAATKIKDELVSAGLWHATPEGIEVHDYLDYNPSCAEVTKRRQELSKIRSKAGSKGAAKRWQADD